MRFKMYISLNYMSKAYTHTYTLIKINKYTKKNGQKVTQNNFDSDCFVFFFHKLQVMCL